MYVHVHEACFALCCSLMILHLLFLFLLLCDGTAVWVRAFTHTHHLLYSTIRKNGTLSISRCCVNFCVLSLLLLFCRAWSQVRRHWSSDLIDNSEGASTLIERRRGESGKNGLFISIEIIHYLPSLLIKKKEKWQLLLVYMCDRTNGTVDYAKRWAKWNVCCILD